MTASTSLPPAPVRRSRRPAERIHYLLLLPALILFTLAVTVPAVTGIFFSFTDSLGFGDWQFIGITNYEAAFSDPAILQSYAFTIGFAVVTVLLVNVIAFLLALGMTSRIAATSTLRAVFVMPMVISGIIIAYVFNFLFSYSVPAIASALGIEPLATTVLTNPDLAWIALVIVTAWQAVPGIMLVYIAGLLAVPGDVYEAAALDGARRGQRLLRITLPLMSSYVAINVILGFKNFLNSYDIIVGLTNGGPGTSTRSIAMTVITGFTSGDYAYQMANATIFLAFTVLVSLLQLSLTRGRTVL
ncbi:carbohydrate ABC transporter permease [Rathayibacter iranicus]|uniref:Sugar ABC transporter permease n=2 Tax=Rathayibacter iranicus TaxID=59737 RepID=A0AAD1AHY8_9MICO|nr:sugar ABC transporter permease [Rathayibacter iranicus]AZZ57054.1 sugar ABC transporter permease [Rathayibacter iranicus]MWV29674.1 ABC transporter permease subunit [Rathayibacter iranicus NCPPB 2253 = VKM Ac-1602]PPI41831.1 sugar ABC transporter permease [Rathayibacter iranicus]PPI57721.1 sugar ABC transporter permease [Rathayibacter iranicus]PPI68523.1 sugar ABC transporter permease [Rathayibacter iranicus]